MIDTMLRDLITNKEYEIMDEYTVSDDGEIITAISDMHSIKDILVVLESAKMKKKIVEAWKKMENNKNEVIKLAFKKACRFLREHPPYDTCDHIELIHLVYDSNSDPEGTRYMAYFIQ